MIVRAFRGGLLVVRQTDHMALSGELAVAWGNARFPRPEPFAPLIRAAAEHDAGWAEWEVAPKVDPATRRPYQFTDVPVEEHVAFYQHGVYQVAANDAHAGLLANLHCQGLHNQRFGTAPEMGLKRLAPAQEAALRQAIVALQRQERELGRQVRIELPTLWEQYDLLQAFDLLSLVLCLPPPRERQVGPVMVRPSGDEQVTITPWPFGASSLAIAVPSRVIADRDYGDDADLRRELAGAEAVTLRYELRAGSS